MRTGRHATITAMQREEFWRRYKSGESALGISRKTVYKIFGRYQECSLEGLTAALIATPIKLSFQVENYICAGLWLCGRFHALETSRSSQNHRCADAELAGSCAPLLSLAFASGRLPIRLAGELPPPLHFIGVFKDS